MFQTSEELAKAIAAAAGGNSDNGLFCGVLGKYVHADTRYRGCD